MAYGGIMADMVYNALRRKLAAAEAAGDVERMERIRELLKPLAPEIDQPAGNQTAEELTDLDVESAQEAVESVTEPEVRASWDDE